MPFLLLSQGGESLSTVAFCNLATTQHKDFKGLVQRKIECVYTPFMKFNIRIVDLQQNSMSESKFFTNSSAYKCWNLISFLLFQLKNLNFILPAPVFFFSNKKLFFFHENIYISKYVIKKLCKSIKKCYRVSRTEM